MLLALGALGRAQAPGIMCLRNMNPYVGSALQDWNSPVPPLAPRQTAPGPTHGSALSGEPLFVRTTALHACTACHR